MSMLLCVLPFQLYAASDTVKTLEQALQKSELIALHKDPTWLRLLHFNPDFTKAKNSEILSLQFFLSHSPSIHGESTHGINPKIELEATLRGIFSTSQTTKLPHAQCRFPARFFWLKEQLNLDSQAIPNQSCKALEDWAKFSSLDSVSLILVSGYFGNPASTFGHLLVKLNNSEHKETSGSLLDESINYGAQVPNNEPIPLYILKGLFGGYVSRFSRKEYYSQDMMYSREEFRDMWEYELNLNEAQQTLLVYHLWEVMGMESTYLFLDKNCGYRVAELLELVTNNPIKYERQPWYLPISVFQELADIENSQYIKKVTFLPSSQRKMYHNFAQLTEQESNAANAIIAQNSNFDKGLLSPFSKTRQAKIVDVLLEYYQYRLTYTDQKPEIIASLNKQKSQLLLARFKLPVADTTIKDQEIPELESPATGAKPRLFFVGLGKNKANGNYIRLGLTGIHYDLLTQSRGSLENSEIKVFEVEAQYDETEGLSLHTFNLASIQKLSLNKTTLIGENSLSWRIRTGFKKLDLDCEDCGGLYLMGGIGKAWKITDNNILYAMLDGEYHQEQAGVSVSPTLGIVLTHNEKLRTHIEAGISKNWSEDEQHIKRKVETRFSFSKNDSLRVTFEKNVGSEFSASYYLHW